MQASLGGAGRRVQWKLHPQGGWVGELLQPGLLHLALQTELITAQADNCKARRWACSDIIEDQVEGMRESRAPKHGGLAGRPGVCVRVLCLSLSSCHFMDPSVRIFTQRGGGGHPLCMCGRGGRGG